MFLQLEKEGEFDAIAIIPNMSKCGSLGNLHYRYHVKIQGTDKSLSPEGFLMENSRIHTYFDRKYCSGRKWKAISCEQMAARAAMDIGDRLVKEGISVNKVICTIFGSNNARLTAVWER